MQILITPTTTTFIYIVLPRISLPYKINPVVTAIHLPGTFNSLFLFHCLLACFAGDLSRIDSDDITTQVGRKSPPSLLPFAIFFFFFLFSLVGVVVSCIPLPGLPFDSTHSFQAA